MSEKKINIEIKNDEDITEKIQEEIKHADEVHIHKSDDNEEVNVDINKKNKTVEVNVEKNGKKKNVKIGWRGVKVQDADGTKVNIQFIPIFLFVLAILGTFLFFIYKVLELIVNW